MQGLYKQLRKATNRDHEVDDIEREVETLQDKINSSHMTALKGSVLLGLASFLLQLSYGQVSATSFLRDFLVTGICFIVTGSIGSLLLLRMRDNRLKEFIKKDIPTNNYNNKLSLKLKVAHISLEENKYNLFSELLVIMKEIAPIWKDKSIIQKTATGAFALLPAFKRLLTIIPTKEIKYHSTLPILLFILNNIRDYFIALKNEKIINEKIFNFLALYLLQEYLELSLLFHNKKCNFSLDKKLEPLNECSHFFSQLNENSFHHKILNENKTVLNQIFTNLELLKKKIPEDQPIFEKLVSNFTLLELNKKHKKAIKTLITPALKPTPPEITIIEKKPSPKHKPILAVQKTSEIQPKNTTASAMSPTKFNELVDIEKTRLLKQKINKEIKKTVEIIARKAQEEKLAEENRLIQERLAEENRIAEERLAEEKRIEQQKLENERKAKFLAEIQNNSASRLQAINQNRNININIKQYFFSMNKNIEERIVHSFELVRFLTSKIGKFDAIIKGSITSLLFKSFFDYDLPGSYHPRNLHVPDIDLNFHHENRKSLLDIFLKLKQELEQNESIQGLPWIRKISISTKHQSRGFINCHINDGEFDITILIPKKNQKAFIEDVTPAPTNLMGRARLLLNNPGPSKYTLSLGELGAIELPIPKNLKENYKNHEFTVPPHDVKNESYFKILEKAKQKLIEHYSENVNLEHFSNATRPENLNTIFTNILLNQLREYKKQNKSYAFVPTFCHSETLALIKWHKQIAKDHTSLIPYLSAYFHTLLEFYKIYKEPVINKLNKMQNKNETATKPKSEKEVQKALKIKEEMDAKQLTFLTEQMTNSLKTFSTKATLLANQFVADLSNLSFEKTEHLSLYVNEKLQINVVSSLLKNSIHKNKPLKVKDTKEERKQNNLRLG